MLAIPPLSPEWFFAMPHLPCSRGCALELHYVLRRAAVPFLKRQQAEYAVGVPTMVLSETSGLLEPCLIAFLGCAREQA